MAPAAKVVPQVFDALKSALVELMLEIASVAVPGLVRVTVCALLVVPTDWEAKLRLVGLAAG